MAKRSNNPDATRQRVLDAAAESFQRHGAQVTSMRDLRESAGVTTGALYQHFPSKKELTRSVIEERVRPQLASTWVKTVREAEDAESGILSVFNGVAEQIEAKGTVMGCPLGNLATELSLSDPDLRAALAGEYSGWRQAIFERLQNERSSENETDLDALAYTVVAMFSGAMAIAKAEQTATALRACALQIPAILRERVG